MVEIKVTRNGAKNRIEYARRFKTHKNFWFNSIHDIVEAIRCYEREGCFLVDDEYITIIHYC